MNKVGSGVWGILLQHVFPSQASRDLAQMNDLQAQLEEANKEKQELQEKVGPVSPLIEKGCKSHCMRGQTPQTHRIASAALSHHKCTEQCRHMQGARLGAISP